VSFPAASQVSGARRLSESTLGQQVLYHRLRTAPVAASRSADAHLFLFDELFRGTNAVERIAAAEAVLTELIADGPRVRP
jgi:hypothetical protein